MADAESWCQTLSRFKLDPPHLQRGNHILHLARPAVTPSRVVDLKRWEERVSSAMAARIGCGRAGRGGSGRNLKLLLLLVQLALRAHASKLTNLGKADCIFTVRVQCLHGYLKKASVHSLNNEILQCPGVEKFQLPQQSRIGNYLIQHLNFRL